MVGLALTSLLLEGLTNLVYMLFYHLKAFEVSFVAITDKTDEKQQAKPRPSIAIFIDRRVKVESLKRLLLRAAKADFYARGLYRKRKGHSTRLYL